MPTRLVAVAVLMLLVGLPRAWAQENLPPQAKPAPAAAARTWSDSTGTFHIVGTFLGMDGAFVRLRKTDGVETRVAVEKLSKADQEFVRQAANRWPAIPPPANPFAGAVGPGGRMLAAPVAANGNGDAAALVDRIEAAVVRIDVDGGFGSGFIIDPKGLVCTNYHVIDGALTARVVFKDQRSLHVDGFAAVNRGKDLAILSVQAGAPLPSLRLSANLPAKLAEVMAFGSPVGFSGTVTKGNVSAIRDGDEVSKVMLETEQADIYRAMGYDGDCTWIQSTAPTSHGSSGGPLVNMQGEVVGINTWYEPKGQSLYFAVCAKEIANLLPKVAPPRPLSTLPRPQHTVARHQPPAGPGVRPWPGGPGEHPHVLEFSITFPSGDTLTSKILATDGNELATRIERASGHHGDPFGQQATQQATPALAYVTNPDGSLYGLCTEKNGVPEGITITVYPNDKVATCATYAHGQWDGAVKTWDADEKVAYWGQYDKGKRHGFCCLFKDGELKLVLQCDEGKTTAVHVISGNAIGKTFADEPAASADAGAGALLKELLAAEHQLLNAEHKIKRGTHDELEKVRRETAALRRNYWTRNQTSELSAGPHSHAFQAICQYLRQAKDL